ncbi:hypothetical protein CYMTET_30781, partial [Cymbomonas tetramitiformis]
MGHELARAPLVSLLSAGEQQLMEEMEEHALEGASAAGRYRGVFPRPSTKACRWQAQYRPQNRELLFLGTFGSQEEGALAYFSAAHAERGHTAHFPDHKPEAALLAPAPRSHREPAPRSPRDAPHWQDLVAPDIGLSGVGRISERLQRRAAEQCE